MDKGWLQFISKASPKAVESPIIPKIKSLILELSHDDLLIVARNPGEVAAQIDQTFQAERSRSRSQLLTLVQTLESSLCLTSRRHGS